jgi:TPR repeat protein
MRSTKPLIAVFLLLFFGVMALAQQSGQIDKERERQRLQLQAVSMVVQVATEAPLWNDKDAAVQVLTDAADLLWVDNPNQSVKWLRKAWEATSQVSSGPRDEKLKAFFTGSAQSQLRTTVLRVARKHDPKLAEEFLKQMSEQEANDKKERGAFDDRTARSEQLLSMAQQVLDSNPEEAFALAEESLADGLSYSLQNILTNLRKKNVQLANRLFDLALARFVSSLPDPSEAQILAGYLFRSGLTFSANSGGQTMLVLNPAQQNLTAVASSEPQRARSFLIAVYERLLTQPVALDTPEGKQRAQQILVLGNLVARWYATVAPELAQSAQGFLAQLQRQLMPDSESGSVSGTSRTSGDATKPLTKEESYERRISELEDSADRESNAAFRKVAYVNAALATRPEDYIRAKRIAAKIDDDDLRADAVSFVLYRAALFFADKAEVEKAMEIAPTISDVSRRAVVKIAVAQHLLSSKSAKVEPGEVNFAQQRALDLLNDIDRDLKKEEPSANAAKILLGRTAVLAKLDKDQALASLERTVQMINKLDRFDLRDGAAPNLGMGAFSASGATVARPRIGFDFHSAIEPLIVTDFEQLSAVAGGFTAKELAGFGRLEVAKLYLKMNTNPSPGESSAVR